MKNTEKILNFDYRAAQGIYWALFCVSSSFAAVFLQNLGYTNTGVGRVLALGHIVCLFLSPALAAVVDRSKKFTPQKALLLLLSVQLAIMLLLHFLDGKSLLLSLCYSSFLVCLVATNPMNTQLCIAAEKRGVKMNYGIARGIGSLTYGIASAVFGAAVERFSPNILPTVSAAFIVLQFLILFALSKRLNELPKPKEDTEEKQNTSSISDFFLKNPRYCVFLLGVAMMYFTHTLFGNFFINIVRNLGGNAQEMGLIGALMAVVELPGMFLLDKICRKWHVSRVMSVALVFFALKFVLMACARTIPLLYMCQFMQGLGFALVVPGLVRYAEAATPPEDSAKSQAMSYNSTTLGSIFSAFLGGRMFDIWSVNTVLVVGCAVAVTGLAVCELAIDRKLERVKL